MHMELLIKEKCMNMVIKMSLRNWPFERSILMKKHVEFPSTVGSNTNISLRASMWINLFLFLFWVERRQNFYCIVNYNMLVQSVKDEGFCKFSTGSFAASFVQYDM